MKNKMRVVLISTVAAILAAGLAFFFLFDRLAISALARYSGIDVKYSKLYRSPGGGITMRNLILQEPRAGLLLFSDKVVLKPALSKKRAVIPFELDGAGFKRLRGDGPDTDTLTRLMLIPFDGSWSYSRISGEVAIEGRTIRVNRLSALAQDIKFDISNAAFSASDNTIKADMRISFSDAALARFPEDLSSAVLQRDPDGWQSLSISLTGDYAKPAIQVTGRLFRLNIRNKSAI